MARYRGPVGKVSRRLGYGISEKGARILSKRSFVPGMHGPSANTNKKMSDYALRLAEKQKARFTYGILEKQFRRMFEAAKREPGETGATLFSLLERRLDNVVFRLGWAQSRAQARQLVCHGHVTVNGRKTNIASFSVKVGDQIAIRPESRRRPYFANLSGTAKSQTSQSWLSAGEMSGQVIALPRREDAEPDINEQFIVEYYSR
jgi:small subunit ribosomal protein S4